jgi:hypothetical protein
MKSFLYELLMIIIGFVYFIFLSIPLAIIILLIAQSLFTIKKLIKWIKP